MKKVLCILMTAVLLMITAGTAFAEGKYVFDYKTDDLLELADIVSGFGGSTGIASQAESENDYDVRRTVIVKTDGRVPDLRGFDPDVAVDGPDDIFMLSFSDIEKAERCASTVSSRSGVIYAECDTPVSINEEEEMPEGDEPETPEEVEIDYHSWGIEYMHADTLAQEAKKAQGEDSEVVVAVVDSGITPTHPIFEDRLAECKDMTASASGYIDENGHGTNVAGVVADCTQGLNVKIMAVKVLDADGKSSASIASMGIEYAARNGADIINASFVTTKCSVRFHDAWEEAEKNDCVMVVSAGNHGINMDEEDCCPSHIKGLVTVTAINSQGLSYNKNCYGNVVDVTAPGIAITCASRDGKYIQNSGTSFAAPHVAAIAAMYKIIVPLADSKKIMSMIKGNTIDLGERGFDVYCGWGMPWLKNFSKDAIPKDILEIKIKTYPEKMTYNYKEDFDRKGLSIEVLYDDGTEEVLTDVFVLSSPEMEYGKNTVTVTLGEHSTDFTVEVKYTWWQWILIILLFGWIWY